MGLMLAWSSESDIRSLRSGIKRRLGMFFRKASHNYYNVRWPMSHAPRDRPAEITDQTLLGTRVPYGRAAFSARLRRRMIY